MRFYNRIGLHHFWDRSSGDDLARLLKMFALPPKADIGTQPRDVRFVPKADMAEPKCYVLRKTQTSVDCRTEPSRSSARFYIGAL
jgi:hypothetical protein